MFDNFCHRICTLTIFIKETGDKVESLCDSFTS